MRRAVLGLAVLAALLVAPSPLLAAPPNQLTEPAVSPATGTVLTRFTLSVRYTSSHGNSATGVVADLGVLTLEMERTSGSDVDGEWSASTLLPAGTWPVTFRASAAHGPQATLSGPILRVGAGATPEPSDPNVRPVPSEPAESSQPEPAPGATQAITDATADPRPAKSGKPAAPPSAAPAPTTGGGGSSGGNGQGAPGDGNVGGGSVSSAAPEPAPQGSAALVLAGGAASNDGAARASGSPEAGVEPGLLEGDPGDEEAANLLLLLVVIVSVAGVALLGTGWMLTARGRDHEREPSPGDASGRASRGRGGEVAAIEERRARRRAQRLPGHDPVLAAMGLEPDDPPPPTRGSARGVSPRSRPRGRR